MGVVYRISIQGARHTAGMATETEDVPISGPAAQNVGATEFGDPGKFLAWDIAFRGVKFAVVCVQCA